MNKLFVSANRWAKESDWKDLTLLKFCICAMGMLVGMAVPREKRKPVVFGTIAVFAATYTPLMRKFLSILAD